MLQLAPVATTFVLAARHPLHDESPIQGRSYSGAVLSTSTPRRSSAGRRFQREVQAGTETRSRRRRFHRDATAEFRRGEFEARGYRALDALRPGSLLGTRTRPSDRDSPIASSAATASPRCRASDEREDHRSSAMTESNGPYAELLLSEKKRARARLNKNHSTTAAAVPAAIAVGEPKRSRGAFRNRR